MPNFWCYASQASQLSLRGREDWQLPHCILPLCHQACCHEKSWSSVLRKTRATYSVLSLYFAVTLFCEEYLCSEYFSTDWDKTSADHRTPTPILWVLKYLLASPHRLKSAVNKLWQIYTTRSQQSMWFYSFTSINVQYTISWKTSIAIP